MSVSKTDEIFNQLIGPLGRIACIAAVALQALVIHRIERAELIARGEVDKRHEEESKKWPYRLGTMSDEEFKARIQAHRAALRIETADVQHKEVHDEIYAWLLENSRHGITVKQQEKKIAATKQLVAAKEEYAAVYTRIKEILEANNERVRTQEVGRNASTNRATDRNGCENNNNGHSNLSAHMIEHRGCNAAENRKCTTEKLSNIVAKSHWLSETPQGVTPLCTNPQIYVGRTDLAERTAEIAIVVKEVIRSLDQQKRVQSNKVQTRKYVTPHRRRQGLRQVYAIDSQRILARAFQAQNGANGNELPWISACVIDRDREIAVALAFMIDTGAGGCFVSQATIEYLLSRGLKLETNEYKKPMPIQGLITAPIASSEL